MLDFMKTGGFCIWQFCSKHNYRFLELTFSDLSSFHLPAIFKQVQGGSDPFEGKKAWKN